MMVVNKRTEISGQYDIVSAFEALGFGEIALGPEFEKTYSAFHWVLMPHPLAKTRLYAIPSGEELLSKPWDSWYFINGEAFHHVHYATQLDSGWRAWIQPEPAPECPEELVGIQWFWYNESRTMPSLLIK